jgi:hypothetical protein
MSRSKISREELEKLYIDALNKTDGRIVSISKFINRSWSDVYAYLKNHPEFKLKQEARRAMFVEKAEENLGALLEDPDNDDIVKFVLKTLARETYSEKSTQEVKVSKMPEINISFEK